MIKIISIIYSIILLISVSLEFIGIYYKLSNDTEILIYTILFNLIPILYLGFLIFLSKKQITKKIYKLVVLILSIVLILFSLYILFCVWGIIAVLHSDFIHPS